MGCRGSSVRITSPRPNDSNTYGRFSAVSFSRSASARPRLGHICMRATHAAFRGARMVHQVGRITHALRDALTAYSQLDPPGVLCVPFRDGRFASCDSSSLSTKPTMKQMLECPHCASTALEGVNVEFGQRPALVVHCK